MILFLSKLFAPALSPILIVCELLLITILTVGRRPRVARGAAVAALVILLVASNRWFTVLVTSYLESRNVPDGPLPKAEAIVVLSSDVEPATSPQPAIFLDQSSANRLLYAAQLYREVEAPAVIVSGGRLPWLKSVAPMSEGMAEVLELMGVPKSAITQEPQSANTYENAVDVKMLLTARHIGRILLVTSAMHMPRALALFKHQGIDAIAAPCDFVSLTGAGHTGSWRAAAIDLIPAPDKLTTTSEAFKEFLGLAVYHAAGLL